MTKRDRLADLELSVRGLIHTVTDLEEVVREGFGVPAGQSLYSRTTADSYLRPRRDELVGRQVDALAAGRYDMRLGAWTRTPRIPDPGTCGYVWFEDFNERCGLQAGHVGPHISWPGGFTFARGESSSLVEKPATCDVSATSCRRHEPPEPGDCPWDGHDHPRCTYEQGHTYNGTTDRHSWQAEDDTRPTMDPHAPAPTVYAIPGRPVVGRTVVSQHKPGENAMLWRWTVQPNGTLINRAGQVLDWVNVLVDYGPLQLAELTDDERASEALYGPIGARWGNPDEPCPYAEQETDDVPTRCNLGVGHAGPHTSITGATLGLDSIVDGPTSVTPHQSAREVCNCGRPDQHRPGCNRYRRVSHTREES